MVKRGTLTKKLTMATRNIKKTMSNSTDDNERSAAVSAALALAKITNETARALADAKIVSDTQSAVLINDIAYIKADLAAIKITLDKQPNSFVNVDKFNEVIKTEADHESRLRDVEKFKDTLNGKVLGVAASVSFVFGILDLVVWHFFGK
jgi:hypothetical protein